MTTAKVLLLALALTLPFRAAALDSSAGVKVTPILKTGSSWNGAPITYPGGTAEVTGLLLEIAPGAETGWHKHPVPSFGMVLEGTLEVTLKDGKTRRVNAGEAIAEVVDTWHNGRNVGGTPLKLVVFYAGAAGTPLTVRPQ
jgi:quercetin dioxygenase-like cupin family protein